MPSSVDLFLFAILEFFLAKYGCPLLATLPVLFLALWALMKELSSNDKADDVAVDGGRADVSVGGQLPPCHDDGGKEMIREALMSWEEEVMVIEAQLLGPRKPSNIFTADSIVRIAWKALPRLPPLPMPALRDNYYGLMLCDKYFLDVFVGRL
ncbi:unnamed protein product [Linum trigynum]